jgi:hypothetical protein
MASSNDSGERTGLWRIGLDGSARETARLPGSAMLHDVSADRRLLIHHGFERIGARAKGPGDGREHEVAVVNSIGESEITDDGRQLLLYDVPEAHRGWSLLRPIDGGPPVRLSEGAPLGISPDSRWALVDRGTPPAHEVVVTPTGAGPTRPLSTGGLQHIGHGSFLDATHVLLDGAEPDRSWRTFLVDVEGGKPLPVTPEGTVAIVGTLGGDSVIGRNPDGTLARYPLHGGEPRPLTARIPDGTGAIRGSADGRFLFVGEGGVPGRIDRLDLATGRRLPWKTLQPEDPAGLVGVQGFDVTPDGAAYAYRYLRFLQDLYVVEGLR